MPNSVYWDSCLFIDLLQQTEADGRFEACEAMRVQAENKTLVIVTSALTIAEVNKLPEGQGRRSQGYCGWSRERSGKAAGAGQGAAGGWQVAAGQREDCRGREKAAGVRYRSAGRCHRPIPENRGHQGSQAAPGRSSAIAEVATMSNGHVHHEHGRCSFALCPPRQPRLSRRSTARDTRDTCDGSGGGAYCGIENPCMDGLAPPSPLSDLANPLPPVGGSRSGIFGRGVA